MAYPYQMQVITNLQPAKKPDGNLCFPEGGILAITTSKPADTEDIVLEVRDANGNVIEVDQVDPEFDPKNEVMQIRLQREGDPLKGTTVSLYIGWDDANGEHHAEPVIPVDVY